MAATDHKPSDQWSFTGWIRRTERDQARERGISQALGMSANALAIAFGVPATRIGAIMRLAGPSLMVINAAYY